MVVRDKLSFVIQPAELLTGLFLFTVCFLRCFSTLLSFNVRLCCSVHFFSLLLVHSTPIPLVSFSECKISFLFLLVCLTMFDLRTFTELFSCHLFQPKDFIPSHFFVSFTFSITFSNSKIDVDLSPFLFVVIIVIVIVIVCIFCCTECRNYRSYIAINDRYSEKRALQVMDLQSLYPLNKIFSFLHWLIIQFVLLVQFFFTIGNVSHGESEQKLNTQFAQKQRDRVTSMDRFQLQYIYEICFTQRHKRMKHVIVENILQFCLFWDRTIQLDSQLDGWLVDMPNLCDTCTFASKHTHTHTQDYIRNAKCNHK